MQFLVKAILLLSLAAFSSSQSDEASESDAILESELQNIPDIETDFSCEDRNFGYYADTDSECTYFHLCHPIISKEDDVVMAQFTFLCPNETVFSQKEVDCVPSSHSIPCDQSEKFFSISNDQFYSPKPVQEGVVPTLKKPNF